MGEAGASLERLRTLDPFDPALQAEERELRDGLQKSITHLLAVGRRGFSDGNHAAAERAFRSVLAVDPNNESARGYLSYIETIRRASQTAGGEPAAFEPPEAFASDAEIRAEGSHQNALAAEASGDRFAAIGHDLQAKIKVVGIGGAISTAIELSPATIIAFLTVGPSSENNSSVSIMLTPR